MITTTLSRSDHPSVINSLGMPLHNMDVSGKWAKVAPVKWNSLLQSDHSSKLQFDCEIQWLIQSFQWLSYSNMFLLRMFLPVFGNLKGWNYFQKLCYRYKENNYPWHYNFFFVGVFYSVVFKANIHRISCIIQNLSCWMYDTS